MLDIFLARTKYTEARNTAIQMRNLWRTGRVPIDSSGMGIHLLDELECTAAGVLMPVNMVSSKLDRFIPQNGWIKLGKLVIPRDKPWFDEFCRELLALPDALKDDQVDAHALTQFAKHMRRSRGHITIRILKLAAAKATIDPNDQEGKIARGFGRR